MSVGIVHLSVFVLLLVSGTLHGSWLGCNDDHLYQKRTKVNACVAHMVRSCDEYGKLEVAYMIVGP